MKAVIMAGGEGKRLRPLTCTLPKPMAKILGKPIIEYIFDLLISGGVTEAGITLGYLPHVIEKKYECGYKNLKLDFIGICAFFRFNDNVPACAVIGSPLRMIFRKNKGVAKLSAR